MLRGEQAAFGTTSLCAQAGMEHREADTQEMDVSDWQNSPLPPAAKVEHRHRFVVPPALAGIVGTILLHAMLIQTVSLGSGRLKPKTPEALEPTGHLSKAADLGAELVLLSLPASANSNQAAPRTPVSLLPDMRKIQTPLSAELPATLDLETLALSDDEPLSAAVGGADAEEQARLSGIYTGQLQARIDRVWRRPRTPVSGNNQSISDEDSFRCEAQIVQDVKGNVQEVLLPRCNGSLAWQRSLVIAIQQASPMPAAPDAKVFRSSITLSFVGLTYRSGEPEDSYELPLRKLVKAN
jgi:hypothetical protein